jgi:hypothetical protein
MMPDDSEPIYLGFDPGGDRYFGVAILSGTRIQTGSVSGPTAAFQWAVGQCQGREPRAAGIDTLLHWYTGPSGHRPADDTLRKRYPDARNSIIAQGGLRGSMIIGGAILANQLRGKWPGILLNETHPKLLAFHHCKSWYRVDKQRVLNWFGNQCRAELHDRLLGAARDDEFDAALSAWATREAIESKWCDLIGEDRTGLFFPAGDDVEYRWPCEE